MLPPEMRNPYESPHQNLMYSPPGYAGQQYQQQYPSGDPLQYMQQYVPAAANYPMQNPYGMNEAPYSVDSGLDTRSSNDPPPRLSNNPATATIVLFKELTAYPNYGNPSRNADILYTGNRGTWTFQTPPFLFVPGNLRAQIRIRAVLDDHANVPVNRYSARIIINGATVHNGVLPLEHGTPFGGIFTNWRDLTFNIPNLRRVTQVTMENTSTAGTDDWIALDWMEIRLFPR